MIQVLQLLSPYPTICAQKKLRDGFMLNQPRICKSCKDKTCAEFGAAEHNEAVNHSVCSKGMSVVVCCFPIGEIVCNGLLVKGINVECSPSVRKANRAQKIAWQEIRAWYENITQAIPIVEAAAERSAQEAIHGLHDVKTAVSLVTRNAEAIIATLHGTTDDERIEAAPHDLKALLKSVQLLHTRLSASSILANPAAASHGQRHPTPIHKVCFKMVRLFAELALRSGVKIRMTGTSYAAPSCYDSFETIPLVLLDNAVKYSHPGSEIIVSAVDLPKSVRISVESHGPLVPEAMKRTIFERGIRGPESHRFVSRGSGLGLYIASIVARAHGFPIQYACRTMDQNGVDGSNMFYCEVPLNN